MDIERKKISITLGIPAGRAPDYIHQILSKLEKPTDRVEVLIARWVREPLSDQALELFNGYFPTREVLSKQRHAPAMRNAIIWEAESSHLLFLDDDMVPGSDLLHHAIQLAEAEPGIVYQGIPYRVANSGSWLARTEGKLYERGYKKYINRDGNVSLLDARMMLAPVKLLRETPFDESLVFGGGEGRQLAECLREKGATLRLARGLDGAHINRDTIVGLVVQKLAHGKGRGYQLVQDGPGENGWLTYIDSYAKRHFVQPAVSRFKGELETGELLYIWGTNTIFWVGVLEEIVQSRIKSSRRFRAYK